MIFSTPLAALGLLTAVGLTAVYCFRRKSPPKLVSSLMFWPKPAIASASARRRDRLQVPPIFWLELFILLTLVAAALTPLVWRRSAGTLHVILDDTPSMYAGNPTSAAACAEAFLADERKRGTKDTIRVRTVKDTAGFKRALAAARSALAPGDEILVLTDHAPTDPISTSGLRWEAFGQPLSNCAITACRRLRKSSETDSLFLEVRRFGKEPDQVVLTLKDLGTHVLSFDQEGRARLVTSVPAQHGDVEAYLPDDALASDNAVCISPPNHPSVSVALDFRNEELAQLVRRALGATGGVSNEVDTTTAQLVVTDRNDSNANPKAYHLVFTPGSQTLVRAPVWSDPGSTLLEGVTLDGEPYAVSALPTNATPIALLGSTPLIAVTSNACHLAFADPALPFFRTPAFPVLMQNVIEQCAEKNGFDGHAQQVRGLLDAWESDLTNRTTVSLGKSAEIPEDAVRTSSVSWIPAVLAALALAWHFALIRRRMTLVILAVTVLALARPVFPKPERHGSLVVVTDRSLSMPANSKDEQVRLIRDLANTRPKNARLGIVSFGATAAVEQRPSSIGFEEFVQEVDPSGSDVGSALALAKALADSESPMRMLVVSDGLFSAPVETEAGSPVDTLLSTRPFAHDLFISRIDAPASVAPRSIIPVTAWVQSPDTVTNDYRLLRGTNVIARGSRVFAPGLTPLTFRDFAGTGGLRRYTLDMTPSAEDPCPENNAANFLVKTEGARKLLVLNEGSSGAAQAMRAGGVDVDVREAKSFKGGLSELENYAGVILENVPAKSFTTDFLRDLSAYVHDLGGGLAMTGGERSFGPGGWYKTPVEDVLPVSLELRQEHRKYSLALAIVMDRSGSMACRTSDGRTKMDMANLGAVGAIDMLTSMDQVSVIAVDSQPHLILSLQDGDKAQRQRDKVLGIQSMGGGIFVEEGLMAAFRQLEHATSSLRHIILFADAADSEEPGDYEKYLKQGRDAGITVSVIALGSEGDCDADLLKRIAEAGGGECWFEAKAEEIPRLFLQDTFLTAKTAMCTNMTPLRATSSLRTISDRLSARIPAIGGYNLTYLREEAEQAIVTEDEDHAPLLAYRRAGLGRTLAFTGELAGPHAAPLMTSEMGAEITAALARWTRGDERMSSEGFTFERRIVSGGLRVTAVADEDNPATAVPNAGLVLMTVKEKPGEGAMSETTALRWESSDTLSAFVPLKGNETAFPVVMLPSGRHVVLPPACLPYPSEYRRSANPLEGKQALERISAQTGGRFVASVDGLWEALPVVRRSVPLAPFLFLFAACVFLILVFIRRLGLGLGWSFKRVQTVRPVKVKNHAESQAKETPEPQPQPNATAAAFAKVKRRN